MKRRGSTLAVLATACMLLTGCGAERPPASQEADTSLSGPAEYDSALATELGADDYGMRTYVMAFLKAGQNRSQDSTEAAELQRAHLDNIRRLADEGKLLVAGPFLDDGPLRGIYVFDVQTVEEARQLTMSDPAIQVGRLEMELHPWYGSAALRGLADIEQRIVRESF